MRLLSQMLSYLHIFVQLFMHRLKKILPAAYHYSACMDVNFFMLKPKHYVIGFDRGTVFGLP